MTQGASHRPPIPRGAAYAANGPVGPSALGLATHRYAQTYGRKVDRPTLQPTAGSRVMPAPPQAPRCSRTHPTRLPLCRLQSPVARRPAARAASPEPRRGSGSPLTCTCLDRQAVPVVVGCAHRRRRLRWARLRRESVHPRLGISRPHRARH